MNFELYIENLGAIEKAEITINPLTILAGENGTGKSFVTKFLYSVLNVLMRDVYKEYLNNKITAMLKNLDDIGYVWKNDNNSKFDEIYLFLNNFKKKLDDNKMSSYRIISEKFINDFNNIIELYNTEKIRVLENYKLDLKNVDLSNFSDKDVEFFVALKANDSLLDGIVSVISEAVPYRNKISQFYIKDELKYNFQISTIDKLIRNGKDQLKFSIKKMIDIEISNNQEIKVDIKIFNMENAIKFNRLVFFESSIYWRLSRDIIENSNRPQNYYLSDKISDERLTGIPKHFLDLRDLVFANFKDGERPKFIEECANDLQKSLNGKFNTDSYDLSFETNQGQTINKTLVSFGMTNLGILQAVLNKNIINKGSFVFIDEPESNLHPEWQAVLADILVKLAENGVFVVITTHSSDMLKALDVISQERKNNDEFISVNYFEKGGNLLPLSNNDISQIQQARLKLLETYDEMVLRGYLL